MTRATRVAIAVRRYTIHAWSIPVAGRSADRVERNFLRQEPRIAGTCPRLSGSSAPNHLAISRNLSTSQANSVQLNADAIDEGSSRGGPYAAYERRVASGQLSAGDKSQEQTVRALQSLYDTLHTKVDEARLDRNAVIPARSSGSWFSKLMPKVQWNPRSVVRGLYMYGGVGTGKTMLMDMFYEELPKTWRKKRIHFHDFMLDVHSQLQKARGLGDPLGIVAEVITNDAVLLCIDEFMVTDVADALILNRLFDYLFRQGAILVSTSNRHPDQLYEGGLQRDLFLPFIASLKAQCDVLDIGSDVDYRKRTKVLQGLYYTGTNADHNLQETFRDLVSQHELKATTAELRMGRTLQVPLAAEGCAYFQFHELCEMPLGAADYFGLFKSFHTLALEGIPIFGSHNRASAYRFVTLVDVMYEHKARFLCSAEGKPFELFAKVTTFDAAPRKSSSRSSKYDSADILVDNELGFAKDRTISRLTEMNSSEYLKEFHESHPSAQFEVTIGKHPK